MAIKTTIAAGLVILAGPLAAAAQDVLVLGGGKLDLTFPPDGATQELGLYAEVERAGFYSGVLGLVSNDQTANKIELYAGYRAETDAGFRYDLSYSRFIYPNDGGDCCGEMALSFGQLIRDKINLKTELTYDPAASLGSVELGAEFAATDALAISTNYQFSQLAPGDDEKTWDIGVGYDLSDTTSIDLRYYGGVVTPGYFGISASFETSLLGG